MPRMSFSDLLKNVFYIMLIFTFAQPLFKSFKDIYKRTVEPRTKVGYVEINGMLADANKYIPSLRKMFKDTEIKAIVLKIDSVGGVAGSSQVLFNELMELHKEYPKQVVALTENICTSGAYWVATAADHIIASPVAWVGSIGAYIPFRFKLKDFLLEHKVRYESTAAGAFKNFSDPFVDTTADQEKMLQELCDQTYQEFTQAVANRRSKLAMNKVQEWANGRVFIGRKALELGLIDEVGSISNVMRWLKEKALIEGAIEWVKPPKPSVWMSILGQEPRDETEVKTETLVQTVCKHLEEKYLSESIVMKT